MSVIGRRTRDVVGEATPSAVGEEAIQPLTCRVLRQRALAIELERLRRDWRSVLVESALLPIWSVRLRWRLTEKHKNGRSRKEACCRCTCQAAPWAGL